MRIRMRSKASRDARFAVRMASHRARSSRTRLAWILPIVDARGNDVGRLVITILLIQTPAVSTTHRRLRTTASLRARARADAVFHWSAVLPQRRKVN